MIRLTRWTQPDAGKANLNAWRLRQLSMISKLVEKLRNPDYRKAFVASQININVPFQIRALLKARGKTQEWLATKTGMRQPRISGLMTPGKTRPNIETLRRIAEAFDCGLVVRFAPFSELAKWSDEFDPEQFNVPMFADDPGFVERKPIATQTTSTTLDELAYTERNIYGIVAAPAPRQLGEPSRTDFAFLVSAKNSDVVDISLYRNADKLREIDKGYYGEPKRA
jgi:transcriptional regulator with XRE-family HTH domain